MIDDEACVDESARIVYSVFSNVYPVTIPYSIW